ncbi:uncharacterized protein [Miscanthus floridulus]|uniref:uncharacterized protein n=1 Tax=Miscanthus floridulus TaxID=154761 RepID=UPI00345A715D
MHVVETFVRWRIVPLKQRDPTYTYKGILDLNRELTDEAFDGEIAQKVKDILDVDWPDWIGVPLPYNAKNPPPQDVIPLGLVVGGMDIGSDDDEDPEQLVVCLRKHIDILEGEKVTLKQQAKELQRKLEAAKEHRAAIEEKLIEGAIAAVEHMVLPEEGPMQEQEFDSPLIENDPTIIDVQTVDSLIPHTTDALSYSFNLEEYLDEDEISSSATCSKEALSEETKNQLRDILSMFEKDIADLVQDTDSMRVFLSIKGNPSLVLSRVLSHLSTFEDQALKVKKAQSNLSDRETLLAKGNSNRQEAKELTQLIYHLKNSSLSIDLELSQLEARRAELEKELENVKATIDYHKSILAQIPGAIQQKKQELLAKEIALHGVRHGALVALTAAQVQTRYELHAMETGFPMGDGPEEHEDLLEEFVIMAEAIMDITSAQDVVNKVFD